MYPTPVGLIAWTIAYDRAIEPTSRSICPVWVARIRTDRDGHTIIDRRSSRNLVDSTGYVPSEVIKYREYNLTMNLDIVVEFVLEKRKSLVLLLFCLHVLHVRQRHDALCRRPRCQRTVQETAVLG